MLDRSVLLGNHPDNEKVGSCMEGGADDLRPSLIEVMQPFTLRQPDYFAKVMRPHCQTVWNGKM